MNEKRSEEHDPAQFELVEPQASELQAILLLDILKTLEEIRDRPDKKADGRPRPRPQIDLTKAPENPTENQVWEWSPGRRVSWVAGEWRTDADIRVMAETSVLVYLGTVSEARMSEVARSTGLSPGNAQAALLRLTRRRQVIRVEGAYRLAVGDDEDETAAAVVKFEESLDSLGGSVDPSAPDAGRPAG